MTKEYGTTDTFYKGEDNRYYKSKEIYEEFKHENETIDKIKRLMYEGYFGYKPDQPGCTYGYKEINELHKFYSADVILQTIDEVSNRIEYALDNIEFNSEFSMMKYVFAIIRNSIKDVDDKEQRKKERMKILQAKEYEDVFIDEADDTNSVLANTANDLSDFLEDDI